MSQSMCAAARAQSATLNVRSPRVVHGSALRRSTARLPVITRPRAVPEDEKKVKDSTRNPATPEGRNTDDQTLATWKYGKTIQDPTLAPTLLAMFLLPAAALLILPFLPKF